ncbi:Clavaminate synthase-like protein [Rhizopogon vinicolor AM-OR11-026]|uniref:Clavaminate synthase-like protein n=1 Tax=Rhizopogon vinicolor AM-OR11-026 TaxID=1314800 RepID=A0A1B7MVS8_9AGAM|nr:Clavaminate synthase-like protein [Rhizopogon vinicolor AM-OR11-026]
MSLAGDLSGATSPNESERKALAHQIRDACMNVEFLYEQQEFIDNVLKVNKEYYSLPLEEKMKLYRKTLPGFTGFSPVLNANAEPGNSGDKHEGFDIVWEDFEPKANAEKRNDGSIRDISTIRNPAACMSAAHYPPQIGPINDRVVGIGAHTCFTILWPQLGIQALQILNSDKKWIDATPIDRTLIINPGDRFARWTRFNSLQLQPKRVLRSTGPVTRQKDNDHG